MKTITEEKLKEKIKDINKKLQGNWDINDNVYNSLATIRATLSRLLDCMDEPECEKCGGSFAPHHHQHKTRRGVYHTKCYGKQMKKGIDHKVVPTVYCNNITCPKCKKNEPEECGKCEIKREKLEAKDKRIKKLEDEVLSVIQQKMELHAMKNTRIKELELLAREKIKRVKELEGVLKYITSLDDCALDDCTIAYVDVRAIARRPL